MNSISFNSRNGDKVSGVIVQDIGHALLIRIEQANRKILRGRTMLFPKHDILRTDGGVA